MDDAKQDPINITGSSYVIFDGEGAILKVVLNSIIPEKYLHLSLALIQFIR
jgi:hypothetical protein